MFHDELIQHVTELSSNDLASTVKVYDVAENFPKELLDKVVSETNLLAILLSKEEQPVGFRTFLESIRIISKEFASIASILLTQGIFVTWTLDQFGTSSQKEQYLSDLVSCKKIGAFAFSEQDISLKKNFPLTVARETADGWELSGYKHMISNATEAEVFLVFAQTIRQNGEKGTAIFIVDSQQAGLSVGSPVSKSGMKSMPLAPVSFEAVQLPEDALLGDGQKEGLSYLSQILVKMRLAISAQALGIAEGVFHKGLAMSTLKRGFGKRLIDVSVNQFKFSEMEIKLAACEAVYHDYILTEMTDSRRVAMLKLMTTATAKDLSDEVVRIVGTYSFIEDNDIERYVNDAKVTGLYGGTTDSLKRIVAQAWL